jgi:hypothetical protein
MKYWAILLTILSFYTSANCKTLPLESIDCAAEILINAGIRSETLANNWNVYQWKEEVTQLTQVEIAEVGNKKTFSVPERGFLFFIDHHPGALYDHPTEVLFVTSFTGQVLRYGFNGPPEIYGVRYFANNRDLNFPAYLPVGFPRYQNTQAILSLVATPSLFTTPLDLTLNKIMFEDPVKLDNDVRKNDIDWTKFSKKKGEFEDEFKERVFGYYEKAQSEKQARAELLKCRCNKKVEKTHTVVINGFQASDQRNTLDNLARELVSQGRNVTYLRSKPSEFIHDGVDVKETNFLQLEMLFGKLASNVQDCCDEVEVFIGGHGKKNGGIDLNSFSREEIYNGNVSFVPPRYENIGTKAGRVVKTQTLKKWLNKIKSCRVRVFIDSCYSGTLLAQGLNKLDGSMIDQGCHCRTVMTTASKRQLGYRTDVDTLTKSLKEEKGKLLYAFFNYQTKMEDYFGDEYSTKRRSPLVQSTDCLLCKDHDGDGLLTGVELKGEYSDPTIKDTDKDGLNDAAEYESGTNPRIPNKD